MNFYAHTPEPTPADPEEPHKVPVEPPPEPPDPNPVEQDDVHARNAPSAGRPHPVAIRAASAMSDRIML